MNIIKFSNIQVTSLTVKHSQNAFLNYRIASLGAKLNMKWLLAWEILTNNWTLPVHFCILIHIQHIVH